MNLRKAISSLLVIYFLGAVVAVADGLATVGQAVSKGTYLNAPGPLIAVQALAALAALRGYRAGAVVLTLACTLSLAAAAFDGDVGHAGLTTAEVALQAIQVALIAAVWALAARRSLAAEDAGEASDAAADDEAGDRRSDQHLLAVAREL
jgi:hypothetical protein